MLKRDLKLGNCRSSLCSDHEPLAREQRSRDEGSVSKLKDLFEGIFTGQKEKVRDGMRCLA